MIFDWQQKMFIESDGRFLLEDGGFFETLKIVNQTLLNKENHLARMENSLTVKGLSIPDFTALFSEFEKRVLGDARVCEYDVLKYVYFPENGKSYFQFRKTLTTQEDYQNGVVLLVASQVREKAEAHYHKTTNRQATITLRQEAMKQGYFEVLFQTEDGYISEGTVSNIFFITKAKKVVTPPLGDGLLAGTVRKQILEVMPGVSEASIKLSDISEYSGCFITNALIGMMPVREIQSENGTVHFSINDVNDVIQKLKKVGVER